MKNMQVKGCIQGLRWAGMKELLFVLATRYHIDMKILDEEKGLLCTTIFYQGEGAEQPVRAFREKLKRSIKEYNCDEETK